MDIEEELNQLKEEEQRETMQVPICCWPASKTGAKFWGTCLLFGGGLWLLGNLGLLSARFGSLLWPLFYIGLGLFLIRRAS